MQEIELKFQIPAASRAAVAAAMAGANPSPRQRLQAVYFDTADRALAHAGMALRIRHEGRRLVQTLKGLGDDGITRAEHNVELIGGDDSQVEPALHAPVPVGLRLVELLKTSGPLVQTFRTDIRRRTRELRNRFGVVELAHDEGVIVAGERRLRVHELEIELVRGSPLAVMAVARTWVKRHRLWLDVRSKAQRGDMLARDEAQAPPRKAKAVKLDRGVSLREALRPVLLSCLDQVTHNASQVGSGEHDDEHVHQLRVGLRRLRTACRLFGVDEAAPATNRQATAVFRQLGASRDRSVVAQTLADELSAAMQASGVGIGLPRLRVADEQPGPVEVVHGSEMQALMLSLYEWTQAGEPPLDATADTSAPAQGAAVHALDDDAARHLRKKLQRLHRKVVRGLRRFAKLDEPSRHRIRKRGKRLRYGLEFSQGLLGRKRAHACIENLKEALDALGHYMDIGIAIDACRSMQPSPDTAFTLGWLSARREALADQAASLGDALAKTPPP
jgi:triphosphatase